MSATQVALVDFVGCQKEFPVDDRYRLGDDFAYLSCSPLQAMQIDDLGLDPMTRGRVYGYILQRNSRFVHRYYGWALDRNTDYQFDDTQRHIRNAVASEDFARRHPELTRV